MLLRFLFPLVFYVLLYSCVGSPVTEIKSGSDIEHWRLEMLLEGDVLPVQLEVDSARNIWTVINAGERITMDSVVQIRDSIFVYHPVYPSFFRLKKKDENHLVGEWCKPASTGFYTIPVQIEKNIAYRFFPKESVSQKEIAPAYEVHFSPDSEEDHYPAKGVFKNNEGVLTGTFITETGDYRFLEGSIKNDSIFLSCFDGAHVFYFTARIKGDSLVDGIFRSGKTWGENWVAVANPDFELAHPDSLTYLVNPADAFEIKFPDLDGNTVSTRDERFKDKVVIIQLMGTWCPNCLDETRYYLSLYDKFHPDGLEIIALAFEASEEFEKAEIPLRKFQKSLAVPYSILFAGGRSKAKAAEKLPMLNHLMSYPTSIFMDRSGVVRKIHTGFYGPGTGAYYDRYKENTETFLHHLLNEKAI